MQPKTNIKATVYTRTTTTVQRPNEIAYRIHLCDENECLKVAKFFQQRRTQYGVNCEEAAEHAGLTRYEWLALESGWIAPYEFNIWRSLASTFLVNFEDLILLADASRRAIRTPPDNITPIGYPPVEHWPPRYEYRSRVEQR